MSAVQARLPYIEDVNLDLIQDADVEETSDAFCVAHATHTTLADSSVTPITVEKRKGGWPKGKKRRKESTDVKPPKTPVTGYVLFLTERRPFYKSSHPEVSFSEITKVLGNEWTNLPRCEKQKYLDGAEADKHRYRQELRNYRRSETYLNGVTAKRKEEDGWCLDGIDENTDDFSDDVSGDLFCEVCDVYFNNLHNKKEHLYGRQHLLAVTDETGKRLSKNIIGLHSDKDKSGVNSRLSTNVPQVVQDLYEMNFDRETEITTLRKHLGMEKSRNTTLVEEIRELQGFESSLRRCLEELSSERIDLAEQLENLRMVPTLFGVINFQR